MPEPFHIIDVAVDDVRPGGDRRRDAFVVARAR